MALPFGRAARGWHVVANHGHQTARDVNEATQQRDAADEGWLEPSRSTMVGTVIVDEGKVVHPSQLIASVGRT
jgi:hypothetical protein